MSFLPAAYWQVSRWMRPLDPRSLKKMSCYPTRVSMEVSKWTITPI